MGVLRLFDGNTISSVEILIADIPVKGCSVSVTTMREVFYGATSQGVAPHFIMDENKICSFFGHRDVEITEEIKKAVEAEILNAIDMGCRTFYFGGYGDFDALCYGLVTQIKDKNKELGITRVYCVPQESYLRKKVRYFNREDYDDVIYLMPSFDGWYKSIYFRNCAMIDESAAVIFYAEERADSGAYKAYKYANKKKKGKRIINLWNN